MGITYYMANAYHNVHPTTTLMTTNLSVYPLLFHFVLSKKSLSSLFLYLPISLPNTFKVIDTSLQNYLLI